LSANSMTGAYARVADDIYVAPSEIAADPIEPTS
jgi:hypothetical protein